MGLEAASSTTGGSGGAAGGSSAGSPGDITTGVLSAGGAAARRAYPTRRARSHSASASFWDNPNCAVQIPAGQGRWLIRRLDGNPMPVNVKFSMMAFKQ